MRFLFYNERKNNTEDSPKVEFGFYSLLDIEDMFSTDLFVLCFLWNMMPLPEIL